MQVRPVVILDEETVVVLAVKITSHAPRYNDPLDYSIIEWEKAGLLRPSTIRVSKILKINKTHMYNRLGRLQPIDIKNLDNLLSKITL